MINRTSWTALCFCILAWLAGSAAQAEEPQARALEIVKDLEAIWTAPPARTPADHSVDGPLMGNGDMGVCLGGPPKALTFHLSKNDFWKLKSAAKSSGPRVFGTLQLACEKMKGAGYRVEQSLFNGVTAISLDGEDLGVRILSWVAASENMLVIELSALKGTTEFQVSFQADQGGGSTATAGRDGSMIWAERKFVQDVDIPVEAAAAMKGIGDDLTADLSLSPDHPATLVLAMASRFKHRDPAAHVRKRISLFSGEELLSLRRAHDSWWAEYWKRSWVEIGNPVLEKAYYQALYSMGAASRDPEFPPGIFGTWITTDSPQWSGDYHLNYNHMAPFYGLYSANRLEQADPQDAPILDFRERGRWYATHVTGTRGVLYPVGIGPKGIETTRNHDHYRESPNFEKGGLFFQQRSNAAYCLVNMAQRWRCTCDPGYGRRIHPFVKEVADFWVDYLKFENGRYVIRGDAVHEGSGQDINPILTLGLLRNSFDLALDLSLALDLDAGCREKWRHIVEHLSGFTTQERNGTTVFRYTEKGTAWWNDNTLGIQHIYPGNAIGLDSDPSLLEVSRNTIRVMQRWLDFNGTNSLFPAAVRVGYDPVLILEHLRRYAEHTYPNGFQLGNPHGIENFSTVPNTINEMLCMSHGHLLRLFPVWPKDRDARFARIRCWGAFLVTSALRNGAVQFVEIHSERGRDCTMVNPWPGRKVKIHRGDGGAETISGERFTFDTAAGETVLLGPSDVSLKELRELRP